MRFATFTASYSCLPTGRRLPDFHCWKPATDGWKLCALALALIGGYFPSCSEPELWYY